MRWTAGVRRSHAEKIGNQPGHRVHEQIVSCPERRRGKQQDAQHGIVGLHATDRRKHRRRRRESRWQTVPSDETGEGECPLWFNATEDELALVGLTTDPPVPE